MATNNYNQVEIKVFVTRTGKFRAKIKEGRHSIPYEVTIGGNEWDKGKGRGYEERIVEKCELILIELKKSLKTIQKECNQ